MTDYQQKSINYIMRTFGYAEDQREQLLDDLIECAELSAMKFEKTGERDEIADFICLVLKARRISKSN